MFLKFAVRDLAILGASAGLWHMIAAWSAGAGVVADLAGVLAGLAAGAAAYVVHEWGHLLAAFAARSTVTPGARLSSAFVFGFDAEGNTLRQFVIMSLGGFVATALLVWGFYTYLPDDLLASRVARGVVVFLALLGVVLELPLFLWGILTQGVPAPADVKPGRRRAPAA